jgi:2-polyprenyl-3-methyl-5-hydroxy-6-metoxy-1,4-benzoquinol methylase
MACPLCGSSRRRELARVRDEEYGTSDKLYLYVECLDCLLVYLPHPPLSRLKKIYPPRYYSARPGEALGLLQRIKGALDARFFRRLLSRLPGKRLRVLDVGGGTGWMATAMRRADARVAESAVVDLDPGMRAAAEAQGHRFHASRIENFKSGRRFDLIALFNLIEHVADPGRVLRQLRKSLAPRGLLVVKTPNTDSLDRRLFESTYWGGYHAPRHWALFNRENFTRLAKECGLELAGFSYTQGAPQWTPSLMALGSRLRRAAPPRPSDTPMFEKPLAKLLLGLSAGFDFLRLPFSKTSQMFIILKRAA